MVTVANSNNNSLFNLAPGETADHNHLLAHAGRRKDQVFIVEQLVLHKGDCNVVRMGDETGAENKNVLPNNLREAGEAPKPDDPSKTVCSNSPENASSVGTDCKCRPDEEPMVTAPASR